MSCNVIYDDYSNEWKALFELGVSLEDIEALDLNTLGEKTINVTYENYSGTLKFTIVERKVVAVAIADNKTIYSGTSVEEVLNSLYCRIIYHTGYMEQMPLSALGVTEDNFAGIDLNVLGEKTLTFTYEGLSCSITFEVKELQLLYTLTGEDLTSILALKGMPILSISVYENNTAEVTLSGVDTPVKMEIDIDRNQMFLAGFIGEDVYQLYRVRIKFDLSALTFTNVTISDIDSVDVPLENNGTFSGSVDGKNVTFTLYKSDYEYYGYTVYTVEDKQYVLIYVLAGENSINIGGIGYFELDAEGNTFTVINN